MDGSVYQGNIKDLVPFLLRPGKLNLWPYLILIPVFFAAAFFLFRFFILRFDIKTPGRGDLSGGVDLIKSRTEFEEKKQTRAGQDQISGSGSSGTSRAQAIITALGGAQNIDDLDNCISRLRVVVKDPTLLADDKVFVSKCKAMGVIHMGERGIQIIYGPQVGEVAAEVHDILHDQ